MEEPGISRRPSIYYRPINPNDLDRLEKIHRDIFPIKYAAISFLRFKVSIFVSCENNKGFFFFKSGMSLSFSRVL